MDAISFGEWLRRNRKSLGLTQAQLAANVNCATITLRKIEAEERKPSAQIAEQFARVFEIPANEHKLFLGFARGDWHMAPAARKEDIPWLPSATTTNIHVPSMLTTLIGREHDVSSVKVLLLASSVRLVTLAGPPGVGKTRLSQSVAFEVSQIFTGGIFFIEVASLKDDHQLALSIQSKVGMKRLKVKSPLERLIHGIADRQVLLVLDNVEHLGKAASRLVFELLTACPGLKILVTSREILHLACEQVYPVLPLEFPAEAQLNSMDINALSEFSALAMFIERARLAQPGFALNRDNLQVVTEICKLLDGLPLAIELHASRSKLMTPHALLSHMSSQYILCTKRPHPLHPHQETLYQAIQRSYNLLTAQEKRLFAFLSVFKGEFTLAHVEDTFSGIFEHNEFSDLIAALVDKSLLQIRPGLLAEPRLSMLNTINYFAAEQFVDEVEQYTV